MNEGDGLNCLSLLIHFKEPMQIKITKAFICSKGAMHPGSVVEFDDEIAVDLISNGLAEAVSTKRSTEKAVQRTKKETR